MLRYRDYIGREQSLLEYYAFIQAFDANEGALNESESYEATLNEASKFLDKIKNKVNLNTMLNKVGLTAHKSETSILRQLIKSGAIVGKVFYLATKVGLGDESKEEELKRLLSKEVKKENIIDFLLRVDDVTGHLVTLPIHIIDALTGWHIGPDIHKVKKGVSSVADSVKSAIKSLSASLKDITQPKELFDELSGVVDFLKGLSSKL